MTYGGQAVFGVTADFASVPEVGDFVAAIADEVAGLGPAGRRPPAPSRRRSGDQRRPATVAARAAGFELEESPLLLHRGGRGDAAHPRRKRATEAPVETRR